MGSVVLPHLRTGWHVDQAILSEEDRLVVIRFGRDHDPDCMRQDEVLYKVADKVKNFAVCNLDALTQIQNEFADYSIGYLSLRPRRSSRFQGHVRIIRCLHRHVLLPQQGTSAFLPLLLVVVLIYLQHMMIDFGTGNNNKLNWVLEDKQELIDIIETIYRGAKKGRGLVVSPKDYSTRYRY